MQIERQHQLLSKLTCKAIWLLFLTHRCSSFCLSRQQVVNSSSCATTRTIISSDGTGGTRTIYLTAHERKKVTTSTQLQVHLLQKNDHESMEKNDMINRRSFFSNIILFLISSIASMTDTFFFPNQALAVTEEVESGESQEYVSIFKRVNDKLGFGYEFLPPPSVVKTSNKPLQTHLDEINLPTERKGYTYGVTVDPIRITSLREFGTPSEVAAKIVMAELRRDGVLDVTLANDAKEDIGTGAYDIEYISDGKRGKKHFLTRTIVKDGKLFVLTVQVKEDDWSDVKNEVIDAVASFRVY